MLTVTIIKFLHLIIVIGVITSVFIPNCHIKKLAFVFLIFLLFQFALGWKKCGLTEIEYMILGEETHKEGFIYRLVKPLITVPERYFYNGVFVLHLVWVGILYYQLNMNQCWLM